MKMRAALFILIAMLPATIATSSAAAFTEFIQKPMKTGFNATGGKQIFKTKAGTAECEQVKASGAFPVEKSATTVGEYIYEKCKAFGLSTAKITPTEFKLNADGKISIHEQVLIRASEGAAECEVELEPELSNGRNSELGTITYTNNKPGITLEADITGISYDVIRSSGGGCGSATEGEAKNGEYIGTVKTLTEKEGHDCDRLYIFTVGRFQDPLCRIPIVPVFTGRYELLMTYTSLEIT